MTASHHVKVTNPDNTCVICGEPLTPNKNKGPSRLYCSLGHKNRAWSIRMTDPNEYKRVRAFFDLTSE